MYLSDENYHSIKANKHFFSNSQYKNFKECESRAIAEINGDFKRIKTKSMLVSSFVDAYFEGTLASFKMKHDYIFKKGGKLLKDYAHAEYIIKRIEKDKLFKNFLSGSKQIIKKGKINGIPFKIKIDSLLEDIAIVDLKVMADMKFQWKNKVPMNFIEFYGYDIQLAIYQHILGQKLPAYIATATKEYEPNLCIIQIPQDRLDMCLQEVKDNIIHFNEVKEGKVEPRKCMTCDWCKKNKDADLINYDNFDEYIRGGFTLGFDIA